MNINQALEHIDLISSKFIKTDKQASDLTINKFIIIPSAV